MRFGLFLLVQVQNLPFYYCLGLLVWFVGLVIWLRCWIWTFCDGFCGIWWFWGFGCLEEISVVWEIWCFDFGFVCLTLNWWFWLLCCVWVCWFFGVLIREFGFGIEQIFLEIGLFGNFPFLGLLVLVVW